jgi:cell division protein FtsW
MIGAPAVSFTFGRSGSRSRRLTLDPVLILIVGGLLLIGLIMVTSASISVADRSLGDPFFFLKRQLTYVGMGMVAAAAAAAMPTSVWERLAFPLLLLAFALLVLVLIPGIGHTVNGSRRWMRLGFVNLQASEVARVLLLMYTASYIVRRQEELQQDFKGFLKPLAILMGAGVLLLLEPDFGATTVLLGTALVMLFLAGVKLRHFFAIAAIAAGGLGLLIVASPYRLKRLGGFINPWADPFNSGFQLTQSLIAIGRGEMFGVGLGASVQKLFYLPEAHTDFVFAVLAEELGLAGVMVVLLLFALLAGRAFYIAREAAEAGMNWAAYFASSFGIWVALQASINVGVNMGLLPTKGLTLPLLSYGGSSLIVTLGWLGVLLRIHHEAGMAGRSAVARKERSA